MMPQVLFSDSRFYLWALCCLAGKQPVVSLWSPSASYIHGQGKQSLPGSAILCHASGGLEGIEW